MWAKKTVGWYFSILRNLISQFILSRLLTKRSKNVNINVFFFKYIAKNIFVGRNLKNYLIVYNELDFVLYKITPCIYG